MKLTTQELIDWAFAQKAMRPRYKLVLLVLAFNADFEAVGRVPIDEVARGASTRSRQGVFNALIALQQAGLNAWHTEGDDVVYALKVRAVS